MFYGYKGEVLRNMEFKNLPYILLRNNIIVDSGEEFLRLTGYRFEDMQNVRLEFLFTDILRVSTDLAQLQPFYKSVFIFAKNLEPREVDIFIRSTEQETIVVFEETSDSDIDHLFPYLAQQLDYNCVGTAVFLAEGSILLKANQLALNCFEEPYNTRQKSIGRGIPEICSVAGEESLQAVLIKVIATGQPFVNREVTIIGSNRGTIYLDILVIPIFVRGIVKYLVETVRDVTEDVQRRKELERQLKTLTGPVCYKNSELTTAIVSACHIEKLSEELRNIIESTDEFIWSVDRDYRLIYFNSSYKNHIEKGFGCVLKTGILMSELFPPEQATAWLDFYDRAITDGKFQVDLKSTVDDRMFSFNFYAIYLDSEIVEITCFGKDLTERMRTEQRIVSQNAILESTIRERTAELQQMVKNLQNWSLALSHDVKASYHDIELCANNILDDVDIRANAYRILRVSKDMTAFILEIMRYEVCLRQEMVKEDVNIKKMFVSIYRELKDKYTNHSILSFATGFPIVSADKILLQQVVFNILSNAMKFSSKKEKPTITIGCRADHHEYVFYVEDNGIGFDMNDATRLFNAFEHLCDKEDYEGRGLGLTTVRNIIERHGGRTWIESEMDVRTVMYFSLPI